MAVDSQSNSVANLVSSVLDLDLDLDHCRVGKWTGLCGLRNGIGLFQFKELITWTIPVIPAKKNFGEPVLLSPRGWTIARTSG